MDRRIVTVVVPSYNEEENVRPFGEAILKVFAPLANRYEPEVIFVDDGSSDQTLVRLREMAEEDSRIKVVVLSRNFGHQAALTAGLQRARGDAVISMDCDFQDPPEVIPELLKRWEAGNKIVYARRVAREDNAFKKLTANLYYKLLSRVSDVDIPRQVGDFRLIDRIVLKRLLELGEHARYLRGMVAWLGFQHDFVDFERPDRMHGETHYPFRKMVKLAMDGLLSFSFSPLKAAMWVGVMSILFALGFLAYMLYDHFVRGVPYPLFKWLTVILFGFMGAQFMLVWILGEYVGRIYNEVRRRPLFIVGEEINIDKTPGVLS